MLSLSQEEQEAFLEQNNADGFYQGGTWNERAMHDIHVHSSSKN